MVWTDIFFGYVCPSLGCVMSAAMYAAPVNDLRRALLDGKLGKLNPLPWAVMSGNCLGWCAYAYYAGDPFILASNIPGLILSVWLNMGAAKLQYYQLRLLRHSNMNIDSDESSSNPGETNNGDTTEGAVSIDTERFVFVPQEVLFLRILALWFVILVCVGWLGLVATGQEQTNTIGVLVNINLIFFYGAPLQTMKQVIHDKCSDSIHTPTMVMNWFNTSFWLMYGLAKFDPVIYLPNMIGLFLGITQGVLSLLYPSSSSSSRREEPDVDRQPLLQDEQEEVESELPVASNPPGILI